MLNLKILRNNIKGLSDDTRLRIVNILHKRELTVKGISAVLKIKQPSVSKHLVRLRLLGMVTDRRDGNRVYYSINKNKDSCQRKIIEFIVGEFNNLDFFKEDIENRDNMEYGKKEEKDEERVIM